MSTRPRLRPSVRPLRRGDGTVQLGLSAGVVVEGLTGPELALLRLLDGSRSLPELYAAAAEAGIGTPRFTRLVDGLRAHGLLLEDDAWAGRTRRRVTHVLVAGEGLVPEVVAAGLRAAGIGRVRLGRESVEADLERLVRAHATPPGSDPVRPPTGRDRPDLVVLPAHDVLPLGADAPWRAAGLAHLPVLVQEPRVVVGPLLVPGSGPCLRCLDLQRSDRDAGWPALFAQVGCETSPEVAPRVDADAGLALLAAAFVTALVGRHLDDGADPPGISVEGAVPWPQTVHRVWEVHPRCATHRATPGQPQAERGQ